LLQVLPEKLAIFIQDGNLRLKEFQEGVLADFVNPGLLPDFS